MIMMNTKILKKCGISLSLEKRSFRRFNGDIGIKIFYVKTYENVGVVEADAGDV